MKRLLAVLLVFLCVATGCDLLRDQIAESSPPRGASRPAAGGTAGEAPPQPGASEMAALPPDASIEDTVSAYEAGYARAAREAGIKPNHEGLEYEVDGDDTATIHFDSGLMLMIDPPASYYRVWYVGYPESNNWMLREAQLAVMACDGGITPADEAARFVGDLFEEALANQNNMPSAINAKTPGGFSCSLSVNDRNLVSFWVSL